MLFVSKVFEKRKHKSKVGGAGCLALINTYILKVRLLRNVAKTRARSYNYEPSSKW